MKIKNLAVVLLALGTFSNAAFSMDHAEMKLARSTMESRQIGNQALIDRDAALATVGGENYRAAKATANAPLQAYLDEAVRLAAARMNAVLDAIMPGAGNFLNLGGGGNVVLNAAIAGGSNMFGPNGGRTPINSPVGNTKAQFKAALLAILQDENTMAELAVHSAQVVAVPLAARDSQIYSIMRAVHDVLSRKVIAYVGAFRANNNGVTAVLPGGDHGGRFRRDTLANRLSAAVLAY